MTVIVAYFPESYPILMGDLLISGPEVTDRDIVIPTIGSVENIFPRGSGYSIVGLQQKLIILNDELALAWAGRTITAKTILSELKQLSATKKLTLQDLFEFWEKKVDPNDKPDVELVGLLKCGDMIYNFGFNYQKMESEKYGEVMIAGSGALHMGESITRISSVESAPIEANILERSIATALLVSTDFIGYELVSGEGLLRYFGGGIELISLVSGRFQKIGDITYILWIADEDESGNVCIRMPEIAIKVSYIDDYMLLRIARFSAGKTPMAFKCDDSQVHIVNSILSEEPGLDTNTINLPSFNSRWSCHYVLVRKEKVKFELRMMVTHTGSGDFPLRFKENGSFIQSLEFGNKFLNELSKAFTSKR
jgi:hypothetical protein